MLPKKPRLQNTDLMKTKKLADSRNAKVTVQYIQNSQFYHKSENDDRNNIEQAEDLHEDLEVENVEYLEENSHVEDYIEDGGEKEDNFYPNAIHCLLDLYKNKFHCLMAGSTTVNVAQWWRDIAKDMQESFFEFNEQQIQLKYALLREQYFSLRSKDEIENFDYFGQLHEIYKDAGIENIMNGHNRTKINSLYYKDELFLQPDLLEMNETQMHDFKSEEIVHKEHEFIDMVEKELQAMEGGEQIEDIKETGNNDIQKHENTEDISSNDFKSILSPSEHQPPYKKPRVDSEFCKDRTEIRKPNECNNTEPDKGFSLYLYNQEQERRHREKMFLLEKSLELQERVLEQQQELLRELIKRVPS